MTDDERTKLRARRLLWPRNDGTAHVIALVPNSYKLRKILMQWISTHTIGEFYIGHDVLCFYNEQDATAFELYDVLSKAIDERAAQVAKTKLMQSMHLQTLKSDKQHAKYDIRHAIICSRGCASRPLVS